MPWSLILELGLMVISLLVGDLKKRSELTRRYIDFIQSRSDSFKIPSRIRDKYIEAKKRLEEDEKH